MSQLYENDSQKDTLAARAQLNREILKCYTEANNRDSTILLAKEVFQYKRQLNALQVRDLDIKSDELSIWVAYLTIAYKLSKLLALSILTLPGLVLFAPVFPVARYYSKDKARFLTSISPFRISGTDTLATSKILASLATVPSLYILYTVLLIGTAHRYQQVHQLVGMSFGGAALLAMLILICLSLLTVVSLYTGDMVVDIWKTLRPLILSLVPSSRVALRSLRAQRKNLAYKVTNFINTSEVCRTFELEATPMSAFSDRGI
jgi:glycerol-3-phosphate O-acyltransferase / dihydroxyacetone phosphate acyltransferase